jgi:hypothetical protein
MHTHAFDSDRVQQQIAGQKQSSAPPFVAKKERRDEGDQIMPGCRLQPRVREAVMGAPTMEQLGEGRAGGRNLAAMNWNKHAKPFRGAVGWRG